MIEVAWLPHCQRQLTPLKSLKSLSPRLPRFDKVICLFISSMLPPIAPRMMLELPPGQSASGLPCLQCQPHLQHRMRVHARQARHPHQAGARRSCKSSIFITAAAADQPTGSSTTQQAQSKAPLLNGATAAEEQLKLGTVQQAQSDAPILIGAGGGIFFFWQIGGTQYLNAHYDLSGAEMIGASAGALVVVLAMCKVDSVKAVSRAYELAQEAKIWDRKLGLAGIWGKLVREWLDDILPRDAAEICRTRLRLVVTQLPSIAPVAVQDFVSRQELIDATMASVHVPLFLDGRPAVRFRGKLCIDGSLGDFLTKSNSELLQCKGRKSLMLDYYDDDQLSYSRWDFLKLRSYEDVLKLVKQGEAYAQRLDRAGKLEQIFPKLS